jgi:hypothetical protein
MSYRTILAGTTCLLAAFSLGIGVATVHKKGKQPRIYVGDSRYAHSDWIKDFRAACPHMALVADEKVVATLTKID